MRSEKEKERSVSHKSENIQSSQNAESKHPGNPAEKTSMLSQIAASASGLTLDVFTAPTRNELSNTAQSALSHAGKSSSSNGSGSGNSAWAESSREPNQTNQARQGRTAPEGLRFSHSETHIAESEQEFSSFLNNIDSKDSLNPWEETTTNGESYRANTGITFGEAWARSQLIAEPPPSEIQPEIQTARTIQEQETRDGEDILNILSTPGSLEDQFETPLTIEEEELPKNWGLSNNQLLQIQTLLNENFPKSKLHGTVPLESNLNMIPDFEGQDSVLKEKVHWREQWEGVLSRYTDEVWGGLLPLVKEARKEAEERVDSERQVEPKALRRLVAVLGHLKKL